MSLLLPDLEAGSFLPWAHRAGASSRLGVVLRSVWVTWSSLWPLSS